jgi:oleandomycin transport system ATP-binding protein
MAAALSGAELAGVGGAQADRDEGALSVPILSDEQLTSVVALLGARGFALAGIGTHLPSLDEVFLAITGQKPESTRDADAGGTDGGADADTAADTNGNGNGTDDSNGTDGAAGAREEVEVAA